MNGPISQSVGRTLSTVLPVSDLKKPFLAILCDGQIDAPEILLYSDCSRLWRSFSALALLEIKSALSAALHNCRFRDPPLRCC